MTRDQKDAACGCLMLLALALLVAAGVLLFIFARAAFWWYCGILGAVLVVGLVLLVVWLIEAMRGLLFVARIGAELVSAILNHKR